jgi:hypothetical protein
MRPLLGNHQPSRGVNEFHDSERRETLKYGREFRGTRSQERLCWQGPAAIYQTDSQGVESSRHCKSPLLEATTRQRLVKT